MYRAINPAVYVGLTVADTNGAAAENLKYILNRANGMSFVLAKKEYLTHSSNGKVFGANVLP